MLVQCKECGGQISDKAVSCPHCGFPLKHFEKNSPRENLRKRKKLPNGFGRITKLKGRLRKPYRAMVTVGKDDLGRPIGKLLKPVSYFETYNEAYLALTEYNKDPYDVRQTLTLEDTWDKWSKRKFEEVSLNSVRRYQAAWKYCSSIKDMDIRTIKVRHLKICLDECGATEKFKINIKGLLNYLFEYALEYGYIENNVVKDLKVKSVPNTNTHMVFTEEEMKTLWKNKDDLCVRMMLVLCYSGMRPGELINLKQKNIDIDNNTIIGGSKTAAGINRVIPIHPLIKNIIEDLLKEPNSMNYDQFRFLWNSTRSKLGRNMQNRTVLIMY